MSQIESVPSKLGSIFQFFLYIYNLHFHFIDVMEQPPLEQPI